MFAQINLAPIGEKECAINQSVLHGNIRFVFLKETFTGIVDQNEYIVLFIDLIEEICYIV